MNRELSPHRAGSATAIGVASLVALTAASILALILAALGVDTLESP